MTVNLLDYTSGGTGGDDSAAFTAALADAIALGTALHIEPSQTGDKLYRLKDVDLPNYSTIIAEKRALLRGLVTTTSDMFVIDGGRFDIDIRGGVWRQARTLLKQTVGVSNGAISDAWFRDMKVETSTGWDCEAILATLWRDVRSSCSVMGHRIKVLRQCNLLTFDHCKWQTGAGVIFENGGSLCSQVMFVNGCWFENLVTAPVRSLCTIRPLTFANPYFENCAYGLQILPTSPAVVKLSLTDAIFASTMPDTEINNRVTMIENNVTRIGGGGTVTGGAVYAIDTAANLSLVIDGQVAEYDQNDFGAGVNVALSGLDRTTYHTLSMQGQWPSTTSIELADFTGGLDVEATGLRLLWDGQGEPIHFTPAVNVQSGRFRRSGEGFDRALGCDWRLP